MAGISVPQYEVFKIGSNKLKYFNWDLKISKKEAFKYGELISLFEGQEFRIMANKILKRPIKTIDFTEVFLQVIVDRKSDFSRVTGRKGVTVNGINYKRFVGTTGGLKSNTLMLCNSQYVDKLNELFRTFFSKWITHLNCLLFYIYFIITYYNITLVINKYRKSNGCRKRF